MKYWNKARLRRVRERRVRAEERALQDAKGRERAKITYTRGAGHKNAMLMLGVLGSEINRKMLARLRRGGAMSVSKLADPFHITLPAAVTRVNALERANLITTHKHGRIRFCVYNPSGIKELSSHLSLPNPFSVT